MKKTKILMEMVNGSITPMYPERYSEFLKEVKNQDKLMVTFQSANKKTAQQLGYLYASDDGRGNCGVYAFIERELNELGHDTLYFYGVGEVELNVTSIDNYFKDLYSRFIQKEFNKTDASREVLASYIKFIENWSIQHIGYPLPEPKQGGVK